MVLKPGRKPRIIARATMDAPTPPAKVAEPLSKRASGPAAVSPVAATEDATEPRGKVPVPGCPRLYDLQPAMVGPLPAWDAAFAHAAGLGFDGVLLAPVGTPGEGGHLFRIGDPDRPHPALGAEGDTASTLAALA